MADEGDGSPVPEALLRDVMSIVSHDLRTPLSVLHTTASMLLNPKYQLTPQQIRDQHERIRRNVDVMNRMISDLSDMVSLRRGQLTIDAQPVVLSDVFQEAVTANEAAAQAREVPLAYEPGSDVLNADADRARLTQLLQILVGHALKSCKPGNRIGVTLRRNGALAELAIAGDGPGIAADDLPFVFDPYSPERAKPRKGVEGLDLFIAKGIVDAHGGQIQCESTSAGTTFRISLPLSR